MRCGDWRCSATPTSSDLQRHQALQRQMDGMNIARSASCGLGASRAREAREAGLARARDGSSHAWSAQRSCGA